jgi:hypothetical protein
MAATSNTTVSTVRPTEPPISNKICCNGTDYYWCHWHNNWNLTHATGDCEDMIRAKKAVYQEKKNNRKKV